MLSPRFLARIVVGLGTFACLVAAFVFALGVGRHSPDLGAKAIAYALMAVALAVLYRYVER
jgi:hypothetical protein